MKYAVEVQGRVFEIEIRDGRVTVDGKAFEGALGGRASAVERRLSRGPASRAFQAHRLEQKGAWRVSADGQRLDAVVLDPRQAAVQSARGGGNEGKKAAALHAPMPGLVLRVLVAEGVAVAAGQGLIVVEAMKMENELKAPGAGTVSRVHAKAGDRVQKGALLIELA